MNNKVLVEVYYARTDKIYDFELKDSYSIECIVELMSRIICIIENIDIPKNNNEVLLINGENGRIYNKQMTSKQLGIFNGCKLMLID